MMLPIGKNRGFSAGKAGGWNRRRSVFTLIELLVAITILAFGLVGVLSAYGKTADTLKKAQDHIQAMNLAKREMGRLQVRALIQNGLSTGTSEGGFSDEAPMFTWRREVETLDNGIQRLAVEVTQIRTGRSVRLETYAAIREQ